MPRATRYKNLPYILTYVGKDLVITYDAEYLRSHAALKRIEASTVRNIKGPRKDFDDALHRQMLQPQDRRKFLIEKGLNFIRAHQEELFKQYGKELLNEYGEDLIQNHEDDIREALGEKYQDDHEAMLQSQCSYFLNTYKDEFSERVFNALINKNFEADSPDVILDISGKWLPKYVCEHLFPAFSSFSESSPEEVERLVLNTEGIRKSGVTYLLMPTLQRIGIVPSGGGVVQKNPSRSSGLIHIEDIYKSDNFVDSRTSFSEPANPKKSILYHFNYTVAEKAFSRKIPVKIDECKIVVSDKKTQELVVHNFELYNKVLEKIKLNTRLTPAEEVFIKNTLRVIQADLDEVIKTMAYEIEAVLSEHAELCLEYALLNSNEKFIEIIRKYKNNVAKENSVRGAFILLDPFHQSILVDRDGNDMSDNLISVLADALKILAERIERGEKLRPLEKKVCECIAKYLADHIPSDLKYDSSALIVSQITESQFKAFLKVTKKLFGRRLPVRNCLSHYSKYCNQLSHIVFGGRMAHPIAEYESLNCFEFYLNAAKQKLADTCGLLNKEVFVELNDRHARIIEVAMQRSAEGIEGFFDGNDTLRIYKENPIRASFVLLNGNLQFLRDLAFDQYKVNLRRDRIAQIRVDIKSKHSVRICNEIASESQQAILRPVEANESEILVPMPRADIERSVDVRLNELAVAAYDVAVSNDKTTIDNDDDEILQQKEEQLQADFNRDFRLDQTPNVAINLLAYRLTAGAKLSPLEKETCKLLVEDLFKRFNESKFHFPINTLELNPAQHCLVNYVYSVSRPNELTEFNKFQSLRIKELIHEELLGNEFLIDDPADARTARKFIAMRLTPPEFINLEDCLATSASSFGNIPTLTALNNETLLRGAIRKTIISIKADFPANPSRPYIAGDVALDYQARMKNAFKGLYAS